MIVQSLPLMLKVLRNVTFPYYIKPALPLGPHLPWSALSVILKSSHCSLRRKDLGHNWDAHHTHSHAKVDCSAGSIHIITAHVTTLKALSMGVMTPPRLLSGDTGLHNPRSSQPLLSSGELSHPLRALISPAPRGKKYSFYSGPFVCVCVAHHETLDHQTAKCQTSRPQKKLFISLVSLEI